MKDYQTFFDAICKASPVPVAFENIQSGAKGFFHTEENLIAIKDGMSEIQNVKTVIHEMVHAKFHNLEAQQMKEGKQSRNSKEVEAESVAYIVCQHYGIDTSGYSFAYVATWSQGKEMPELKESLNTIRQAASELITSIDEKAKELTAEKGPAAIDQKTVEVIENVQQLMGDTLKDRITIDPPFKLEQPKDEPIKVVDARKNSEKKTSVRKKIKEEKAKETKNVKQTKSVIKKEVMI